MSSSKQTRIGLERERTVPPGNKIVLYRKGSKGTVVGEYASVEEITRAEKEFNPLFNGTSVYNAINGRYKTFNSFKHQCKVRPIIRKID